MEPAEAAENAPLGFRLAFGGLMAVALAFLFNGWAISHQAPAPFWGLMLVLSAAGFLLALREIPSRLVWFFAAILAGRFLLDLSSGSFRESFEVKSIQRFVGYIFVFIPFAAIELGRRAQLQHSAWARGIRCFLVCGILVAMAPSIFEFGILDQGMFYAYLGILALLLIDAIREDNCLGNTTVIERGVGRLGPFATLIMSLSFGPSRAMFLAGFLGLLYYLISFSPGRGASLLRKLLIFGTFMIGSGIQAAISPASPLRRLLHSGIASLLGLNSETLGGIKNGTVLVSKNDTFASQANALWRLAVWRDAFSEWWHHPILGIGFKKAFSSLSVQEAGLDPAMFANIDVHNSWLQVLMRGGVVLAIPFMLYWAAFFLRAEIRIRILTAMWFVISLATVSFETPHLALPAYLILGLIPWLGMGDKRLQGM
jgi:hypothetical protein